MGNALFRRTTGIGRGWSRLFAAVCALGSVGLGLWHGGMIQLAALTALIAVTLVVEARIRMKSLPLLLVRDAE